jgi:D-alanyl-D-alanine carboxypeptidase
MMNAEAQRLGMASTRFVNPNGLPDDNQVTTARDLAVLARALWVEFPEYRGYFDIPAIRLGRVVMPSGNALLEHYPGTNGMKTGYICSSGFNIIASASRYGRTVIVVVLGGRSEDDRSELAAGLLDAGFDDRLYGGIRPELARFAATAADAPPVNMRDYGVCGPPPEGDDAAESAGPRSALGPRFVVGEPVAVYTGRADPPGSAGRPPANVPLPRLRPQLPDVP